MDFITDLFRQIFSLEQSLSPFHVASFVLLVFLVYILRREKGSFLAFLAPAELYKHKSTRMDVALLLINNVLTLLGVFARFAAVPVVAAWVAGLVPRSVFSQASLSPAMLALIVFMVTDFATYWIHRIHHDTRLLWPLHAVHHSASVLTPLTTYRAHPIGGLVATAMTTVIFGVVFGLLAGTFTPDMTVAEIAGVNAFILLASMTVTNFHHSHIWISFGPVLERILISPAQHQIHHSVAPRHHNRNYGNILALWDWMFGTLYIVREKEELTFGLDSKADAPLMTHRLGPILIDPLRRMLSPAR